MYRLASERVLIESDDGPSIEVERLRSWPLYWTALRLYGAYTAATGPAAQLAALTTLYVHFVEEAQPTWAIADHRGLIPPTAGGLLRLQHVFALAVIAGWLGTINPPEPEATAADATLPEGGLRDAVNTELRRKRKSRAE